MENRRLYQLAALARFETGFSAKTQMFAAAVTATEMQFRPFWHRLIEYCYVMVLTILKRDAGSISVGVSQISVRHFASFEGTSQFQSLLRSMSAQKSISTCCKIIDAMDANHLNDVRAAYNGNSSIYYRRALKRNYELLQELDAYRRNIRS